MDYTISLAANGNEVTTWNFPSASHGDTAECHAEPPTCGCPEARTCEFVHSVSDADFGYWNSAWGDPPIHEFACTAQAVVIIEVEGYGETDSVALCAEHAEDAR